MKLTPKDFAYMLVIQLLLGVIGNLLPDNWKMIPLMGIFTIVGIFIGCEMKKE